MATYRFSAEYYRALARIVLDTRYRDELNKVRNDLHGVIKTIKDGGFTLSIVEIDALKDILNNFNFRTVDINLIIDEINGEPINDPIPLTNRLTQLRETLIASPIDKKEILIKAHREIQKVIDMNPEGIQVYVDKILLLSSKEVPPPTQVKPVNVVP